MTTQNPFQYLLPVSPQNFVGRRKLVGAIASNLVSQGGDSHAIIAGRRFGKSSILLALMEQLSQHTPLETGGWRILPLFFDFKSRSFSSEGAFFASIIEEIRRDVDADMIIRPPENALFDPVPLKNKRFRELAEKSSLSVPEFEDALGYILAELETTTSDPIRLVILLDEIDETLGQSWTRTLYSQLRALIYMGDLKDQIKLVLTGSGRFFEEVDDEGSPFWNVLQLKFLENFDQDAIEQLTARAVGLPPEAAQAVWNQGGGHPFLIQYLLYHLWEKGLTDANAETVQLLASRFRSEQFNDLNVWEHSLKPSGLRVYQVLNSASDWVKETEIHPILNDPTLDKSEVKKSLNALCYHGLAIHKGDWEHYKQVGSLFKTWFEEQGKTFSEPNSFKIDPIPPEEIDKIMSIEGNKDNLRLLLEQLKTPLGVTPFVGAGLSMTFGIPGWTNFLKAESKRIGIEKKIEQHIDKGEYEEAAEELLNTQGDLAFNDSIENAFGDFKLQGLEIKGAVSILPHLASGLIVTTNFDRVLEKVFTNADCSFEEVVWGAKVDIIIRAFQKNLRFLLKIHGDVLDSTDRILTKKEYQKNYGDLDPSRIDTKNPLPKLLFLLGTRSLLFLGCSLNHDRTVAILKNVSEQFRIGHFAIVAKPNEKEEYHKRLLYLNNHGIRPIWYPAGEHNAVELLLRYLIQQKK